MTDAEWEDFIHSSRAVGCLVQIQVSREDRAKWPTHSSIIAGLQKIHKNSRVVQFDASVANGVVGKVVEMSFCGWLKLEIPDHGVISVPGWYLMPLGGR